ncbi:TetR/AcrR family transcriptional regulator [Nannocystis sp. ILAH1]|uniref:TetR/AcrR family transcriptional regulator n=1 Tax=unclassified Nannocystis TaxID=2627009 RepID=UPI0022711AFF|nr:TetR/AcrR family transcriptional regulator [Nannocystis sp. ILAH1]MCY1071913.1 TetR/AcrR family transcriptional regulator [Nannocystis sp. RBIL2]
MAERPQDSANRADRILDAAGVLLLRLGYRKVTIEDVAKQADVGKGTVYLHWRSKEALFTALVMRASIELTEELLARLRADPFEVLPHRFVRSSYLAAVRRPVMFALLTGDTELLGKLSQGPLRQIKLQSGTHYSQMMIARGLLRGDIPHIDYTMRAAILGFYLLEHLDREATNFAAEAKADAIAHVVRHGFEPAGVPDPSVVADAAAELAALLEGFLSRGRVWIYEGRIP